MRTKVKVKIPASTHAPERWVEGEIFQIMLTDGEILSFPADSVDPTIHEIVIIEDSK